MAELPQELLIKICNAHFARLSNLQAKNNKLLVVFSGTPGSGKTTIAKNIETQFKGIRINNDEIRDFVTQEEAKQYDLQNIIETYVVHLFRDLSTKSNGLIILDSSIDRVFDKVSQIAKSIAYPLYVIEVFVPKDILINRLIKRADKNLQDHLTSIDRFYTDHESFLKDHEPDFRYASGSDDAKLYAELALRLK